MITYRKEIDGLRAVAVLGVFFYHLNWTTFSGGWLGVDIFFVISGYLISSLLLKEMDATGTVSLSGFYQRRLRRIMPALLFCLLGSFPMALIISKTYIFTEYSQSLVSALLSFSNIFFWLHSAILPSTPNWRRCCIRGPSASKSSSISSSRFCLFSFPDCAAGSEQSPSACFFSRP